MKVQTNVDKTLWAKVKAFAAVRQLSIGTAVNLLLKEGLSVQKEPYLTSLELACRACSEGRDATWNKASDKIDR